MFKSIHAYRAAVVAGDYDTCSRAWAQCAPRKALRKATDFLLAKIAVGICPKQSITVGNYEPKLDVVGPQVRMVKV